MCYIVVMEKINMTTQNIALRTPVYIVEFLDRYAKTHEWSRNYLINKFLKEKFYELSGDVE